MLTDNTVEQVSPVDRPLFATCNPSVATIPVPASGAPGTGTPFESAVPPKYKIFPAGAAAPGTTRAIATSIFDDDAPLSASRFTNCDKFATVVACVASHFVSGVSPASINPGCTTGSPSAAVSLFAST